MTIDVVFVVVFFYALSFVRPELKEERVAKKHRGRGRGMTHAAPDSSPT